MSGGFNTKKIEAGGGASIGGSITGGKTGSVLFVGPGQTIAQDNDNLFWDDTNNYLGIGTTLPAKPLHVVTGLGPSPAIDINTLGIFQNNGTVAGGANITLLAGTAGQSAVNFADSASETSGQIAYDHLSDAMSFNVASGLAFGVGQNGELVNAKGRAYSRTAVGAGNYTVLITDHIVAKTAITGGGDTISLPAAAVVPQVFYIKDESGNAGTDNITIDTVGAETIDGAASITISTNHGVAKIYSNGTNYFTL